MKTIIFFQIDAQLFGLLWWVSSRESAAMQQTQVWSLSQEDPWGKEMAIHFCIFAWDISWTEEPGRLQSMELQKSQTWLSDLTTAQLSRCFSWTVLLLLSALFSLLSYKLALQTPDQGQGRFLGSQLHPVAFSVHSFPNATVMQGMELLECFNIRQV